MNNLNWISTPSHGYLIVPREDMQGFNPSTYSRENKGFYYLEEDCDAPEYLQHVWGDSWKANYVNCRNVGASFTDDDIDTFVAKEN